MRFVWWQMVANDNKGQRLYLRRSKLLPILVASCPGRVDRQESFAEIVLLHLILLVLRLNLADLMPYLLLPKPVKKLSAAMRVPSFVMVPLKSLPKENVSF